MLRAKPAPTRLPLHSGTSAAPSSTPTLAANTCASGGLDNPLAFSTAAPQAAPSVPFSSAWPVTLLSRLEKCCSDGTPSATVGGTPCNACSQRLLGLWLPVPAWLVGNKGALLVANADDAMDPPELNLPKRPLTRRFSFSSFPAPAGTVERPAGLEVSPAFGDTVGDAAWQISVAEPRSSAVACATEATLRAWVCNSSADFEDCGVHSVSAHSTSVAAIAAPVAIARFASEDASREATSAAEEPSVEAATLPPRPMESSGDDVSQAAGAAVSAAPASNTGTKVKRFPSDVLWTSSDCNSAPLAADCCTKVAFAVCTTSSAASSGASLRNSLSSARSASGTCDATVSQSGLLSGSATHVAP
mmetsp:Transcript_39822/g.109594  ORF Transcript_39822/g.109594 Transcript_39822/m.109594 type:complete len:360 (+) Transcript_39822:305-1384(+)